MSRILLLLSVTSYRTKPFVEAARRLGLEPLLATDRCQQLAQKWPEGAWPLEFHEPEQAAAEIVARAREETLAAIVPTSEETAVVASLASKRLGMPHNPPEAAQGARDKYALRELLAAGGVDQPRFQLLPIEGDPATLATQLDYPCVLKPRHLQASRGVIRVDDPAGLVSAFERLRKIIAAADIKGRRAALARSVLCESYIEGAEFAVEAVLTQGTLTTLALFDKPDPLEGPYFEETIYVTPSGLPGRQQRAVFAAVEKGARALGLRHGPVHAELRLSEGTPYIIELAARTIGGLCAQTLRFGTGISLEELILSHALGRDVATLVRQPEAAGVMMIPVPAAGVLRGVSGIEAAERVRLIEGLEITMRPGEKLIPLPEGATYPGFIFARGGASPTEVVAALREAHAALEFDVAKVL